MQLGLHISDFSWAGGDDALGPTLTEVVQTAEASGFARATVMDHLWQIPLVGTDEQPMLEAYATLGYLAAKTTKITLHTMVTAAGYRSPGILAKAMTTLDVLSGGRMMLGIGAGWNEAEAIGLGLDFSPLAERFERLEETLQICLQMWSSDTGPFEGKHYKLGRTLNSPQAVSRPRPRIMIGGAGERKTLLMVARYADACNIYTGNDIAAKLGVLRDHCDRENRDYDHIEKTSTVLFDVGPGGERVPALLGELAALRDVGISFVYGRMTAAGYLHDVEIIGREVIPVIQDW